MSLSTGCGKYCPISPAQVKRSSESESVSSLGKYCPISPAQVKRSSESESVSSLGKYCPTSPFQQESVCSNFHRSISGSLSGNYCPISSYFGESDPDEPEPSMPDSAIHGGASLKRRRLGSDDSGSDDSVSYRKKPRNRYPFMEAGVDAATRKREIMALRANSMNGFLLKKKKKKKKATSPIAAPTLAKDSDQVSKLKDLMLRWGKLEQAQSQLDRDRAKLIQEHTQLLASWS